MQYVVKRDVPELMELMTAISAARCNLSLISRSFIDELYDDKDALGGVDSSEYKRLSALHECIETVITALEHAQEMTDAIDGSMCTERHLEHVRGALFTPKDERTGWQKHTLYSNHVVEKDGETPQQSFDRYQREHAETHVNEVELW